MLTLTSLSCADRLPQEDEPTPLRPTRGYILISLDTLRADHLGCYGYPRETSPFLDRLAQRAALFENAIVQYPSTLTSHMSIFTGLYPAEHGVYPPDSVLSSEIETLPEAFRRSGFRTAGFTEGGYVHGRFGFRRGFDVFRSRDRQDAAEVERTFERGRQFLRGLGETESFFLFLHTYSVHAPYDPPPAYRERFWPGAPPPGAFPPTGPELSRHNALGATLPNEVRDYFVALYDAEIRRLDDILSRFFDALEDLGLAGETTVILTSDHGEEFQEHGKMNHTQLYREILRVPLLIVHPDLAAPSRHAAPTRSVDLAPTLYELARIEPRGALSGVSLTPYLAGAAPKEPPVSEAFSEVAGGYRSLLRSAGGDLHRLLVVEPPPQRWWTRSLRLDVEEASPLELEVRSFEEPRLFEIWAGDARVHAATIRPEWTRLHVKLPPGRKRLRLLSPDCTLAAEGENLKKVRCYSFQVRGVSLGRAELYDLEADAAEAVDLGAERPETVRALYAELLKYPRRSAAKSEALELDEELRSELEALGYLQ